MGASNILNPTAGAELSPDYGYLERPLQVEIAHFMPRFGRPIARMVGGRGRSFVLAWENRTLATKHLLQQWERQYAQDFFSYQDVDAARYYSGRFAGPLEFTPVGNNRWNIRGVFEEMAEVEKFQNALDWTRDAIFLEERDGFGDDLVMRTGFATFDTDANHHGGNAYFSETTNETAEWQYFGYGFRFWSLKASSRGIVAVSVDGGNEVNVDLYNAGTLASAALHSNPSVNLGLHRVKLRVTGTKNASSSGFGCFADAIEVMQ